MSSVRYITPHLSSSLYSLYITEVGGPTQTFLRAANSRAWRNPPTLTGVEGLQLSEGYSNFLEALNSIPSMIGSVSMSKAYPSSRTSYEPSPSMETV